MQTTGPDDVAYDRWPEQGCPWTYFTILSRPSASERALCIPKAAFRSEDINDS